MTHSIRIIVLYFTVALVIANLAFYTLSQSGFTGYDWIAINVYNPNDIRVAYEYRGFKYFFEYLETFPGLANSFTTVNSISSLLTGQFNPTDYNVVNAILGVLWVLWSPIQLLFTFLIDVINNILWIFGFFVPKHWFS